MKIVIICIILVIAAELLAACNEGRISFGKNKSETRDIFAMDTYMTLTAYGSGAGSALDAAVEEIERLDGMLSTGDDESEVAAINDEGGGILSEDGTELYERSMEVWEDTDGLFDITIYPVMQAWGFDRDEQSVPDAGTLSAALSLVGAGDTKIDGETGELTFAREGMKIDFGGIAKGYTSEKVMEIFEKNGVKSGIISLGGNVQTLGTKTDGTAWSVGIKNPDNPDDQNSLTGILKVIDKAVVTSGGYERYFEEDGKTYHHIIDPRTGYPAESGLKSVTIVSGDGTLADALSTAVYIMGADKAAEFWGERQDEFDMILVTDDDEIYVTSGIADNFTSDYTFEVIE